MNGPARPGIADQITYILTRDLAATSHFYGEVMGLEKVYELPNGPVFRTGPTSYIGCLRTQLLSQEPPRLTITLVSDDVDGWYHYLQTHGVTFIKRPTYSDVSKTYSCMCHDPNGYRVEFQEFRDPDWPGNAA